MKDINAAALNNIIDVFTGIDGCEKYIRLRMLIETLEAKQAAGDEASEKIINIIHNFNRLINLANAEYPKKKKETCCPVKPKKKTDTEKA